MYSPFYHPGEPFGAVSGTFSRTRMHPNAGPGTSTRAQQVCLELALAPPRNLPFRILEPEGPEEPTIWVLGGLGLNT